MTATPETTDLAAWAKVTGSRLANDRNVSPTARHMIRAALDDLHATMTDGWGDEVPDEKKRARALLRLEYLIEQHDYYVETVEERDARIDHEDRMRERA